jgi:hypothetical protein
MAEDAFLDLARIDVLAAADDHVRDAADDVAIALVIHGRGFAVSRVRGVGRIKKR